MFLNCYIICVGVSKSLLMLYFTQEVKHVIQSKAHGEFKRLGKEVQAFTSAHKNDI